MSSNDEVLTTAEAAAVLGCSVPTVTRMARDGRLVMLRKLPGLRGDRLFERSEVDRAAAARAQGTDAQEASA